MTAEPIRTSPERSAGGADPARPSFRELVRAFAKVGVLSFGGPAGQIALMHRLVVDEKRWVPEDRYLHALNYCMLLPGPEAQQLATYVGWLLHGARGGLAAGLLFVLPGALTMLGLSIVYALYGNLPLVAGLFYGIKAAVLAIVVEALLRIARRGLNSGLMAAVAAAAFLALFAFDVPFPLVVLGAGLFGFASQILAERNSGSEAAPAEPEAAPPGAVRGAFRSAGVAAVLWGLPIAAAALLLGPGHVLVTVGLFFSKLAVVTFGGAYAVLAYMAQQAVETHGWLQPGEMLDGLGLAETTPGPLILVTQFVGFLAGFRDAAPFSPLVGGILAAAMTTWVTFAPCFLWIFLGAPFVERLRHNRALAAALRAITAAVVGVILNLALWFALHVVFREVGNGTLGPVSLPAPRLASLDPAALVLALVAVVLIFRLHAGIVVTHGVTAGLGLAVRLLLG